MSKTTFALIAAVSAATGAALTVATMSPKTANQAQNQAPAQSQAQQAQTPAPASPPAHTNRLPVAYPPANTPLPPSSNTTRPPYPPSTGANPVDPTGLFQYGFPGPVADLATRPSLVSSYDRRTKNPHWVAEHITPESLARREGDRKGSTFIEDPSVPEKFRAHLKDYFRSGYDRGHHVPAADAKWSQEAMDSTFYLTNISPQVGDGFNRDYWAHLEDFCRRLTTRYPSVRIVTGPLYLPKRQPDGKWAVQYEVIGNPPNVAVPTHFFKVIFAEDGKTGGDVAVGAFVLPNAIIPNEVPLSSFEVPVESVERASGLEFASLLPLARRKRLCADFNCALVIKDYANRQKAFAKDGKK